LPGEWENSNISVSDSANKTEMDEARNKFKFDGPGSFTLNLKATTTLNENMNYIEVWIPFIRCSNRD
jgi:hypothetical protein